MKHLEGRSCIVIYNNTEKKGRIIRVFQKVGFDGHGEAFASILLDESSSIWESDILVKLEDLKVLD
tara:strand:+ start:593 stop:790 length:198 start_codon:yes stop_codon:yes gene_type:complete